MASNGKNAARRLIPVRDEEHGSIAEIDNGPAYRIYIAGPMTGRPNFNYDLFFKAERHVVNNGLPGVDALISVLNPARHFAGRQDLPKREYLAKALEVVNTADGVLLLQDWETSEGARLEVTAALSRGADFFVLGGSDFGDIWISPVEVEGVKAVLAMMDAKPKQTFQAQGSPDEIMEVIAADPFTVRVKGRGVLTERQPIEVEYGEMVRHGVKRQTYGHPRGDFDRIALIWYGILGIPISAEQVSIMMAGLKLARLAETPDHRDSRGDVIGYMVALDELVEEGEE